MITNQILVTARGLRRKSCRVDEDFIDRLIGNHTVVLIGLFLFILTTSYFFGRPLSLISCWCPAEFTGEMTSYANTMCWVSSTYVLPDNNNTLPSRHDKRPHAINYYQWVPFILSLIAFILFVPGFVWRRLCSLSRLEMKWTIQRLQSISPNDTKSISNIAKQFALALHSERNDNERPGLSMLCCPRTSLRRSGNYLCACYMLSKLMYIISTFFILIFLDRLMTIRAYFHHPNFFKHLFILNTQSSLRTTAASNNPFNLFPYNTICEFSIRGLGDKFKEYVLQCTLPINVFNEKIFLFLWMWILICAILSILSLIKFVVLTNRKMAYMKKAFIHIKGLRDVYTLRYFIDYFLSSDGVFIIRLIDKHVHVDTFTCFLNALWRECCDVLSMDNLTDKT